MPVTKALELQKMNNQKSPKFVFDKIANDLRKGRYDEFFTDPRGGFFPSIFWCETSLKEGDWKEYKTQVEEYCVKCRVILDLVEKEGWTRDVRKSARDLAERIENTQW
jgi:hypothetical protein